MFLLFYDWLDEEKDDLFSLLNSIDFKNTMDYNLSNNSDLVIALIVSI